ncbi:unnamed protein product [Psylliodes chrysocephalus]|uniref:Uncharacterized protein n=1 Tax=Psylliodes chrysocephalus TaxID=3402493 RepID=A0A9P0GD79_9CUCU|nr:unnamed protein product [Psylliodes chrysocephala]
MNTLQSVTRLFVVCVLSGWLHQKKWVAEKQEYKDPKSKKARTVTKYLKRTFTVHSRELIENLHEDLEGYFIHERNIFHQNKTVKDLKQNLNDKEAIIHMDFSENYCAKYNHEIQAYHFGGSRLQLSLHTVVVYLKVFTKSYCTVSQNTTHSPAAIWVHLQPIFKSLPLQIILASRLHLEVPSVEKFTWNFSETGHSKGAPDGVGATCKRTADAVIAAGDDIDSLKSFVEIIQQRCPGIIIFTIDDEDIQKMTSDVQKYVAKKSFSGTQLRSTSYNIRNKIAEPIPCPTTPEDIKKSLANSILSVLRTENTKKTFVIKNNRVNRKFAESLTDKDVLKRLREKEEKKQNQKQPLANKRRKERHKYQVPVLQKVR